MDLQPYKSDPAKITIAQKKSLAIHHFTEVSENLDAKTVQSFGEEWTKFADFTPSEIEEVGNEYFDVLEGIDTSNWTLLDAGCGTGRWSKYLAPKVQFIEAVDLSDAVISAAYVLNSEPNIRITQADLNALPFHENSFDAIVSLGVLHHIPDTQLALQNIAKVLKKNGYCILYLYYALDNRSFAFKTLFKLSTFVRWCVSKMPGWLKRPVCDLLAIKFYMPFILLARFTKFCFAKSSFWKSIPLSYYANKTWHIIRNDALDRFGTPLEQRFTKAQITEMLHSAGLTDIHFSKNAPFWHCISRKA